MIAAARGAVGDASLPPPPWRDAARGARPNSMWARIPCVRAPDGKEHESAVSGGNNPVSAISRDADQLLRMDAPPLGRAIGQIGSKYILAEAAGGLAVIDQHAAHERITYEKLRAHEIKRQPLLVPLVLKLRPEETAAVSDAAAELAECGLCVEEFGEDAVIIREKPADWDLDWTAVLRAVAQEVRADGNSSGLAARLHLKLANYACHHSVRAGQKLDYAQMDALLRDIERTERAGQCNHGRPVYRIIATAELDKWFERA
jgi:DNA mismatch repair protein MutL